MAKKKQTKSVLKKIGGAVATGAEAVIDAGSKAIQAVGEMLPTGKTPPKGAKAKGATAKSPKAAPAPKAAAKAKAPAAKGAAKGAAPTAKKAAAKGATASKAAKPAAKAAPGRKK